jgi:hypothetical protein
MTRTPIILTRLLFVASLAVVSVPACDSASPAPVCTGTGCACTGPACTSAGAAVRLVGDPAQHSAIDAGGLFRALIDQHPERTPALTVLRRQTGDDMADLLYPGQRPRPFRMGVSFEAFAGPEGARAVELARRSVRYRETGEDGHRLHHAEFGAPEAGVLRDLFELVGQRPGTEVTVDRRKAPYARELWLPLFWIFVGGEAA